MSNAPDFPQWFPWAFAALCFAIGWLKGALWHSQKRIQDLRSHAAWVETYSNEVVALVTAVASSLPVNHQDKTS